ncbi:MAG: polyprenyl synthetase family protein [candidate division WOR-3 bacterium]
MYKFKEKFSYYLEALEKILEQEADFFKVPRYLIKGKRLRAIISHISGEIYDIPLEDTINTGYALEMIHAASLIHDDIMDNAETRRGGKVLNKILPTNLAVIVGDLLFTKALSLISKYTLFSQKLSFAVYNMSLGQYREELISSEEYDEHIYLNIIYKKTATLYEVAFETGALLSGFENPQLRDAGRMFGLAFQILDDCDDYYEDEGKPTLPQIYKRIGLPNPLELSKDRAKEYLWGVEWNLNRIGVLEHFKEILDYMWERV